MTGQDIQDKLDELIEDLQGKGKGKTINIALRDAANQFVNFTLSSDQNGAINQAQLETLTDFLTDNQILTAADEFETKSAPVKAAAEVFRQAREPHQTLIEEASQRRAALNQALDNDQAYQTAKIAYEAARADAGYVAARDSFKNLNVSEIYGNLADAKGKYSLS